MAQTGIDIKVTNTVLGSVPKVNANSMLIVQDATPVASGEDSIGFSLDKPIMLTSASQLEDYGITSNNNSTIYKQVTDFYNPNQFINNDGTILWVVGTGKPVDTNRIERTKIEKWVRSTVENGFEYRPRNLMVVINDQEIGTGIVGFDKIAIDINDAINNLYAEGFSMVAIFGSLLSKADSDFTDLISVFTDMERSAPFVGLVCITDDSDLYSYTQPLVGAVGGLLASVPVGVSIGDASLPPFRTEAYIQPDNINCQSLSSLQLRQLGDAQVIFARTRPPRNGLWLNDGSTLEDPSTALSTLEAGRTLASIVDDLREFFTPYINTRVPVSTNGDIDPSYKQVVLDNARSKVITPYIESGDISDARIELVAKNNDMVGTRTWEVKLSILPAPTLRWIDGFVFYVKSL